MPTKFELERDALRLARHQRVAEQIKETDKGMSRETSRTLLLYTGDIVPDPDQPRRFYDEDAAALQELAASIRAVGVLSPIQVRPDPDVPDKYMIIVGERRWRACQSAGVNRIEAVVRDDWDPFQIRAAQYEENEKRQDVSDIARARSLTAMRQSDAGRKRGWEEIAGRLGLQRNHAMRLVGLLQLPDGAVSLIDRRLLPGTHGTELVRLLKRVPDAEIVALAEDCAAPVPGGKARCPVKELARTVTDRLQAIHEQQAAQAQQVVLAEEGRTKKQGSDLLSDDRTGRNSSDTSQELTEIPGATEIPGTVAAENLLSSDLGHGALGHGALGHQSPTISVRDGKSTHDGAEAEFGQPRVFVRELVHAWRSGLLTESEQRLIRDAWQSHPLRGDAAEDRGEDAQSGGAPHKKAVYEKEAVYENEGPESKTKSPPSRS